VGPSTLRRAGSVAAPRRTAGGGSFWRQPRIRRPLDVARLLVAAVGLIGLVVLAVLDPGWLRAAARLVPTALTGVPRSVLSVANVIASFAVLAVLLAIAVDALRLRRFALTSAGVACALGVLGGLGVALLAGVPFAGATTLLIGPPDDSAGLPITAAVAFVVGADLHRQRWSSAARLVLAAAVGCALGLGSLAVPSALYSLVVGATAGLGVRAALGVLPARPPDELVRSVLARAGFELSALRPLEQLAGRTRYVGVRPHAGDLRVTVVDPDRGGVPFARRVWRLLRLRTAAVGRPALSLRGQLERQALTAALADSAGVPAPRVLGLLAAGPALVLVERPLIGTPLSAAPAPAAGSRAIAAFDALHRLHDAGLAHGALSADGVVLLADGRAGFADLRSAQPAATELQRELDVASLLVAVAKQVGVAQAVAALRSTYSTSPVAEVRLAALLQPLTLARPARRAVRGTPLLRDLRAAVSGAGAGDVAADLPRLERLRPRTVVSVVAGTVAAYVLATQLSQVSLASALQSAQLGWLAVAVLGSALTYLGAALALQAFVPVGLSLARTALVQLASSFLTLVTPPAVGHVGLNIRYLQRAGVPTATAAANVAVKEGVTVAVTMPVLLICGWLSGVSSSRLALLPSGDVLTVLLVAATVLVLVALAPASRRRLEPLIRRTLPQLLASASDPRRLGTALVGVLVLNGGYVLALDASLRAFSASLAVPALVVVYLAASTLGSVAPTPGGLGAVEAALVGGLTTTGVPVASAITAVLAFRAATFWLPAPIGWAAFVALQRRSWI